MTSLIPYHAWRLTPGAEPASERFSSLSPGELSKLCHLDLYASLRPGDDPVARSARYYRTLFTRATAAPANASGCQPCLFPSPLPPRRTAATYPCFAHRSSLLDQCSRGNSERQCAPIHATDNLAHPDTNGYRRPLLSRSLLFERRCLCSPDGTPVIGIFRGTMSPRGQPLSLSLSLSLTNLPAQKPRSRSIKSGGIQCFSAN